MSDDEWDGPDGGDLNELERDAAHFEATHDGADWTDVEPEPWATGTRVMWSHGRGVAGTVHPRDEWPYPDDLTRYPGDIFVRWEDGATTLVAPSALTRVTGAGPAPYTAAEFSDPAPF